ncbi:CocE/NonD family hydrolase [Sphaerisporangium flaviroseum]|uniref:CocE/NonD family hydrolase n=1 Tax=Sphaerisporangium flaviroseum TaxID=509199 RepID=A0ABP7HTH9_9ACTN
MLVTIPMADGTRLAATLFLPERLPAPCLLEALPYRKDDVTYGYRAEYEALAADHGYAVCRVDVRGTGSSEGVPEDEYPASEVDDLCQVIEWLAGRPWCDGGIGMYGTSYSGFNALCVAAARPPALRAICSIYASDDRYTDDVHYSGGVHRWLDIVDYPAYMAAMNALPPVPEVYGDGWREEWLRRLAATEPWLPRWMGERHDGAYWRQGSLRPGHDRIAVPTMLVAGWADGYANVVPRLSAALERNDVPYRVVAGPWSHSSPDHALPGPGIELLPEMVGWWDRWLRGDRAAAPDRSAVIFIRSSTPPSPDRPMVNGEFRTFPGWPALPERPRILGPSGAWAELPAAPDIGVAAWNNCAGALPWGQPLDQSADDARCVTVEWDSPADGLTIVGHPRLRARVRAETGATLAVRLCDVAPDGASELITRGVLLLAAASPASPAMGTGNGARPQSRAVDGSRVEMDVEVELDVVAHRVIPGHRLRLALATSEWPNVMASLEPARVEVDLGASTLLLPLVGGPLGEPASGLRCTEAPVPDATDVVWTIEQDVLQRTTRCRTRYGSTAEPLGGGTYADLYEGEVTLDHRTRHQTASARSRFDITWPDGPMVGAESRVEVVTGDGGLSVTVDITATENGTELLNRRWTGHVALGSRQR